MPSYSRFVLFLCKGLKGPTCKRKRHPRSINDPAYESLDQNPPEKLWSKSSIFCLLIVTIIFECVGEFLVALGRDFCPEDVPVPKAASTVQLVVEVKC